MSGRLAQRERALVEAARPTIARLADDLARVKPAAAVSRVDQPLP